MTTEMLPAFKTIVERLNTLIRDNSVLYLINDDSVSGFLVVEALQKELNLPNHLASNYMIQAHNKGCCLIYKSTTSDCENVAAKLRQYDLTITVEKEAE